METTIKKIKLNDILKAKGAKAIYYPYNIMLTIYKPNKKLSIVNGVLVQCQLMLGDKPFSYAFINKANKLSKPVIEELNIKGVFQREMELKDVPKYIGEFLSIKDFLKDGTMYVYNPYTNGNESDNIEELKNMDDEDIK